MPPLDFDFVSARACANPRSRAIQHSLDGHEGSVVVVDAHAACGLAREHYSCERQVDEY